jgi:hypothetical protein
VEFQDEGLVPYKLAWEARKKAKQQELTRLNKQGDLFVVTGMETHKKENGTEKQFWSGKRHRRGNKRERPGGEEKRLSKNERRRASLRLAGRKSPGPGVATEKPVIEIGPQAGSWR